MSGRLVIATVALAMAAVWSLVGLIVPSTASGNITTARSTGPVWSTVSAGSEHTCGVRTDHTLWCWGDNSAGQLGLGDRTTHAVPSRVGTESNWAQVSAGGLYGDYTCAVRTDKTLWCWGDNFAGKLGLGDTRNRVVPSRVGTRSDWAQVSAGSYHTCAVRTDNTLWCWGVNFAGQLGLGDRTTRAVPSRVGTRSDWAQVSVGSYHTCAVRTNNSLWCWGYNYVGELGLGDRTTRTLPRRVGTRSSWAQVSAGSSHTCAVRTNNTLWCWGDNYVGKLGLGDTTTRTVPRRVVGTRSDWAQLSAGSGHTCATRFDHTFWCWGGNGLGQLGLGDTEDRTVPEMVGTRSDWDYVSAGELHTCGVRADNTLWCWGDNGAGQLGLGDFRNRLWPRKV